MTEVHAPPKSAAAAVAAGPIEARSPLLTRQRVQEAFLAHGRLPTDIVMLALAITMAEVASPHAGVPRTPWLWLVASPLLVIALLRIRGLYYSRLFPSALDEARASVLTTALAAMVVLSVRVLLTNDTWVAAQTARFWVFASAYLVAGRLAVSWSAHAARGRGEGCRPTLIVGAGRVGRLTARRLLQYPYLGLKPVGFLDKEPLTVDEPEGQEGLPVLGASWDLERVVAEQGVEHVIVTFSTAPTEVILRLMHRCERLGVGVSFVPRLFERVRGRISVEHLGGVALVSAQPADPKGWQFTVKYTADRVAAAILIVLSAPLLLASAVATWLSLGRPILFRQERVGRDGRPFTMLKFRTMRAGTGSDDGFELPPDLAPGGVEGDDRRTRVGALLRKSCADELPQLFNVLRGEMSLVGPRPERPEYAFAFAERVRGYGDRHRVKSGITGWAQVHGLRGKTSLGDRVEWDNLYIENWSLWLDVKILLLTVHAVFSTARGTE